MKTDTEIPILAPAAAILSATLNFAPVSRLGVKSGLSSKPPMPLRNWIKLNIPLYSIERLPKHAGVYAIFSEGRLMYIGQSSDVYGRLRAHRLFTWNEKNLTKTSNTWTTAFGRFPDITVKIKTRGRFGSWLMDEARLIRRLKPPFNTNIPADTFTMRGGAR